MNKTKIPVILVTGFLGAGKTTFVNGLLKKFREKPQRIALLINEFGSASVDGFLVDMADNSVYEVNRGSIFCSCVRTDFIKVISDICSAKPAYDIIIAEATGISETRNISSYLTEPPVNGSIYIETNICIVDALNFHKVHRIVKAAREQVTHADYVVLNKINLADSDTVKMQEQLVRELNPDIPIMKWDGSEIDDSVFPEIFPGKKTEHISEPFCELPPENIVSVTVRTKKVLSREKLKKLLEKLSTNLLRAKGIVRYPDGCSFVEWTIGGYSERAFEESGNICDSFMVFIGKELDRFRIFEQFNDAENTPAV